MPVRVGSSEGLGRADDVPRDCADLAATGSRGLAVLGVTLRLVFFAEELVPWRLWLMVAAADWAGGMAGLLEPGSHALALLRCLFALSDHCFWNR